MFPAISSLSLCFDSFNAKAKSCCNCRFQTDSIISPIWKLFCNISCMLFKINLDLFDSLHSCADLHHWLYESIPCYNMINVSIFSLYNMLYRSQFSHMGSIKITWCMFVTDGIWVKIFMHLIWVHVLVHVG